MRTNRIWTKEELLMPYFEALYGTQELRLHEDEVVAIIGDTSVGSFRMQTANFRYLLNIEGTQLEHASKKMKLLIDELAGKTKTDIIRMIKRFIKSRDVSQDISDKRTNNARAYKKRDQLNAQYQKNFENKLAMIRRTRKIKRK